MKMLRNDGKLTYVYQGKPIKVGHYAEVDDGSAAMMIPRWGFTEVERKKATLKKPTRKVEDRV